MKFYVIFVILCVVCRGQSMKDCACDYAISLPLTRLGEKFYYIELNTQANWFAAMTFCHLHKMHLANILSESENYDLGQHIKELGLGGSRLWTSGSDLAGEGRWFWTAAGTRMIYKNWDETQPDNLGEEDCLDVRIVNDVLVWNDHNCLAKMNFICEA